MAISRASLEAAQAIQQNTEQVVDSITATDIYEKVS